MPVLPSRVFVLLFFVVKFSCMDVSFVFVWLCIVRYEFKNMCAWLCYFFPGLLHVF